MKHLRPFQLVCYTSLALAIVVCGVLALLRYFSIDIAGYRILFIGLLTGITSFVIHYIVIERFLYARIKVLYRSIRKDKITSKTDLKINLKKDAIATAEKETALFIEAHREEIARLKDQEAFRREFLGNLAHELKTPIFSIQGYVLTLLEGGLEDESVNRLFLERASKAVERMTHILDDLDEISKLEADSIELVMVEFDIAELTKEVFESLEILSSEKQMHLILNEESSSIFVKSDREKIAQVISNLIKNAIYYGNERGEIVVRFHEMEDTILVEVADNGPGIEEKYLPRLFERFYRIEKSRNRNEGGSGLGLAIVKHIIEAHHQTIHVRSTIGVGSTFSFTLEKA